MNTRLILGGIVLTGISDAFFSQMDLAASLARLVNQEPPAGAFPDSFDALTVITGESGRAEQPGRIVS